MVVVVVVVVLAVVVVVFVVVVEAVVVEVTNDLVGITGSVLFFVVFSFGRFVVVACPLFPVRKRIRVC